MFEALVSVTYIIHAALRAKQSSLPYVGNLSLTFKLGIYAQLLQILSNFNPEQPKQIMRLNPNAML